LPAACPRPPGLEADVARLAGAQLERARTLLADVSVHARAPRRFDLALRVDGAAGRAERDVELGSCAEVERAVVLLIGTALQMEALGAQELDVAPAPEAARFDAASSHAEASGPARERSDESMQAPRASSGAGEQDTQIRVQSPAPPAPRARPTWWLRLGATLDAKALPRVAAGPFAGVGMHLRRLRFWLEGRYFLPREKTDAASGHPVELGLLTGALGGALPFARGALTFGPSLEGELGVLRGRVLGASGDGSARTPWIALLAGGHAEWAMRSGVALALDALVGMPLVRPRFVVDEQPTFYRTSPLTARVAVGVRVHVWP
jgi:hypothetical protein